MKKVNLTISKSLGKVLDQNQKSVKGFVKVVNNEMKCNGTKSDYFITALGSLFSETEIESRISGKKETTKEKRDRIINGGLTLANKLTEKQKKESVLFKTLSDKETLFALLKNNLPCFYDNENRQFFAKQIKIGFNVSNLSEETKIKFENSNKYIFVEFIQDEKPLQFFIKIDFIGCLNEDQNGLNDLTRKQRIYLGSETKESDVFYFDDKMNICTLANFDKCTWEMLLPAFCYGYKKQKLEDNERAKEAKKEAEKLQKLYNNAKTQSEAIFAYFDKIKAVKNFTTKKVESYKSAFANKVEKFEESIKSGANFDQEATKAVIIECTNFLNSVKIEEKKESK